MKIDRDVETVRPQAPRETDVVNETREAARPFDDDDVVQCGVVAHHRLRRSFNQIRESRGREAAAESANRGRGEYHVADQAQSD